MSIAGLLEHLLILLDGGEALVILLRGSIRLGAAAEEGDGADDQESEEKSLESVAGIGGKHGMGGSGYVLGIGDAAENEGDDRDDEDGNERHRSMGKRNEGEELSGIGTCQNGQGEADGGEEDKPHPGSEGEHRGVGMDMSPL